MAELKSVWGQNIAAPQLAIENVNIDSKNIQLMSPDKKPTIKISLKNGVEMIKFDSSQEEFEKLIPADNGCTTINAIVSCGANEWNGKITPQLIVEDYEIVGANKYYF